MKEHNVINHQTVERLKGYYPYDEENKTFTIPFHYERLDEVLLDSHIESKKPQVSPKIIEDIGDKLHSVPNGYHANVEITIDNHQGYDSDSIMQAIIDVAYDRQFIGSQQYKKTAIRAGFISLFGIFWIVLSFAGSYFSWWGDPASITSNVISGVLNILAVVFIWEAISTIVIHQNRFIREFRHFVSKMRYLIIKDKDGKEIKVLLSENGPASYYRSRASSEWLLMFGSFFFFAITMLRLIRYFGAFFIHHYEIETYELVISPILLAFLICLGVFAVLIYKGYLKLLLPSVIINFLSLCVVITIVVLVFVKHAPKENIVSAIVLLGASIMLTIGLAIRFYVYKKNNY